MPRLRIEKKPSTVFVVTSPSTYQGRHSLVKRPAIGQIRAERHGGHNLPPAGRANVTQASHGSRRAFWAGNDMQRPDSPARIQMVAHASLIRPDCRCLSLSRRYLATGSHKIRAQTFRPGARMITLTAVIAGHPVFPRKYVRTLSAHGVLLHNVGPWPYRKGRTPCVPMLRHVQ